MRKATPCSGGGEAVGPDASVAGVPATDAWLTGRTAKGVTAGAGGDDEAGIAGTGGDEVRCGSGAADRLSALKGRMTARATLLPPASGSSSGAGGVPGGVAANGASPGPAAGAGVPSGAGEDPGAGVLPPEAGADSGEVVSLTSEEPPVSSGPAAGAGVSGVGAVESAGGDSTSSSGAGVETGSGAAAGASGAPLESAGGSGPPPGSLGGVASFG